jgi:hypothetical protein
VDQQYRPAHSRRTFQSVSTQQLDLSLLAQDAVPAGSTPVPWWCVVTLAAVSVGGCIVTACMWAGFLR